MPSFSRNILLCASEHIPEKELNVMITLFPSQENKTRKGKAKMLQYSKFKTGKIDYSFAARKETKITPARGLRPFSLIGDNAA